MSDFTTGTISSSPSDLQTVTQADERSGRPSGPETKDTTDRLSDAKETSLPQDIYQELSLPEVFKGREQNFESFKKLAAELKLPAETAKKLMEWEASAFSESEKNSQAARGEILQKWTKQTQELFGPVYQREIARALDAADRFGGPELRALLDATGLGSHPVIVKTFHQISQQIGEDVSLGGKVKQTTDKTFAEALYGKAA